MNIMVNNFPLPTHETYSDQAERFPIYFSRGFRYRNAILAEPIKNRSEQELIRAYVKLYNYMSSRGCKSLFHTLDNECSQLMQTALASRQVSFQLAPPHVHRRNADERVIRTCKAHFLVDLASLHLHFSMHPLNFSGLPE